VKAESGLRSMSASRQTENRVSPTRFDFAPNCIWTFKAPDFEKLNRELLLLVRREREKTPESRQCAGREM